MTCSVFTGRLVVMMGAGLDIIAPKGTESIARIEFIMPE
jgi:hypothetical protein